MVKREKIILCVMGGVIAAAGLYYLIDSGSKGQSGFSGSNVKEATDLASETGEALKKMAMSETQAYILKKIAVPWTEDPFLGKPLGATAEAAKTEEAPPSPPPNLAYTGYVMTGTAKLALINGMEYQVGESVQEGEFVLQAIEPQKIVVRQAGGKESFTIPFTGEVLR